MTDWLDNELSAFEESDKFADVAFMKFPENVVLVIDVDFTNAFEKKTDKFNDLKAWIPVKTGGEDKIWTLNVKNPFYRTLIEQGKAGKKTISVIKTGKGENTRFNLVE